MRDHSGACLRPHPVLAHAEAVSHVLCREQRCHRSSPKSSPRSAVGDPLEVQPPAAATSIAMVCASLLVSAAASRRWVRSVRIDGRELLAARSSSATYRRLPPSATHRDVQPTRVIRRRRRARRRGRRQALRDVAGDRVAVHERRIARAVGSSRKRRSSWTRRPPHSSASPATRSATTRPRSPLLTPARERCA